MKVLVLVFTVLALGITARRNRMQCVKKCKLEAWKKEIECQPMPQVVQLEVPEEYESIYPSMVKVNKCGGFCDGKNKACSNSTSTTRLVMVQGTMMNSNEKMCVEVPVDEDLECSCECEKTEATCRAENKVLSQQCTCQCDPQLERACTTDSSRMWIPDDCSCDCTDRRKPCRYPQMWSSETCRCEMHKPGTK